MTMTRATAAAVAFAALAAVGASASEESLDRLEAVCVEDGDSAQMCACLRGFVAEEFSEREIDGAALVLGDPALRDDFPAAFNALISAGYTPDEMVAVYNRIVELQDAAVAACEAEPVSPGE